jgi:hypothetical protein
MVGRPLGILLSQKEWMPLSPWFTANENIAGFIGTDNNCRNVLLFVKADMVKVGCSD